MIYEELMAPLAERKIAMICIIPEKANKLFQDWMNKENKTSY
jgi:hypothetical protein